MGWEPEVREHRAKRRNPWYTLQCAGQYHHLGTDRAKAYRRAAAILEQAGGHVPRAAPQTVNGLCAAWLKGREGEAWKLAYWVQFAGEEPLATLDEHHMQRFADWLCKQKWQRRVKQKKRDKLVEVKVGKPKPLARWSIRHRINFARTAWKWGHEQGWIDIPPGSASTPKPVNSPRDVDPGHLRDAFESLPDVPKSLCKFILSTGCRPIEARTLTWADVDAQIHSGVITLTKHKTDATGAPRPIYLTPPALKILEDLPRTCEWVFPNRNGQPYARNGIRSILARRGIPSIYALRHTFAQWFLEHGGPDGGPGALEELQQLLGHKHIETTQIYAQVRKERMKRVAKRLKGPLAS